MQITVDLPPRNKNEGYYFVAHLPMISPYANCVRLSRWVMILPDPLKGVLKRWTGHSAARLDARRALMLAGLAIIATLALLFVGTQTRLRYQWQSRNTIAELRELPLGQVKIRGVVTFVDYPNKRFWMQDESGAIAINQDPGLIDARQGDVVFVEMKKTHAYDPTFGLPSLGLSDFKVNRRVRNAPLPVPEKAAIPTLSQQAKTGIRVKVEGVVHGAHPDGTGIAQLSLGDEGQESGICAGRPAQFCAVAQCARAHHRRARSLARWRRKPKIPDHLGAERNRPGEDLQRAAIRRGIQCPNSICWQESDQRALGSPPWKGSLSKGSRPVAR